LSSEIFFFRPPELSFSFLNPSPGSVLTSQVVFPRWRLNILAFFYLHDLEAPFDLGVGVGFIRRLLTVVFFGTPIEAFSFMNVRLKQAPRDLHTKRSVPSNSGKALPSSGGDRACKNPIIERIAIPDSLLVTPR